MKVGIDGQKVVITQQGGGVILLDVAMAAQVRDACASLAGESSHNRWLQFVATRVQDSDPRLMDEFRDAWLVRDVVVSGNLAWVPREFSSLDEALDVLLKAMKRRRTEKMTLTIEPGKTSLWT